MTTRSAERKSTKKSVEQPAPPMRMNYFGAKAPMLEKPVPSNQRQPTEASNFVPISEEHLETRAAW
ncbi:MAG: hypothetical protein ABH983_00820 [Candidatus Micrarchaeota archaeon]